MQVKEKGRKSQTWQREGRGMTRKRQRHEKARPDKKRQDKMGDLKTRKKTKNEDEDKHKHNINARL